MPENHIVEVHEIPYLSHMPEDGRAIAILPYYDSHARQFYGYRLLPDGKVAALRIHDMVEGAYIAESPANRDVDCRLPFSEIVVQHFSYRDVWTAHRDVDQDLINGLASLHKYFVLLFYANEYHDDSCPLMIITEVEYAFGNHRAFYDRLHKMVCLVHARYCPNAPEAPSSFAKIVKKTKKDLRDKHLFPRPLVDFYKDREETFLKLRYIRDNIFHHGHSPHSPYMFPDGIGVSIDGKFAEELGDLNLWPEALLKPNRLGSVLAILEFLVRDMFDVMDHLGKSLLGSFRDPPAPIAYGYQVFLRSAVSKHLVLLDEYKEKHWLHPKEILEIAGSTYKPLAESDKKVNALLER